MPNWCSNCLSVQCDSEAARHVIESLFDGSVTDRTNELSRKLRQIALAGLAGLLVPSPDVPAHVLEGAIKLNSDFATDRRESSDRARAYDAFLIALVYGGLSPDTYDELSDLYDRTQLSKLWWGDIPRARRRTLTKLWKRVRYDYSFGFGGNIVRWWTAPASPYSSSEQGRFNMCLLCPIPVSVIVNGFNGELLDALSGYNWNCSVLNTKWTKVDVMLNKDGNYVFSTAWSPALSLIELLPSYVLGCLGMSESDEGAFDMVRCNLFYFEEGCGFQGINDECFELISSYDEESEMFTSNYDPDIVAAFGELL
ncbi:DUF1281 domain-containing protein [Vibrio vulnificus]|nr:DUF1281 domain-containing protein [Vibrio vulnificus]